MAAIVPPYVREWLRHERDPFSPESIRSTFMLGVILAAIAGAGALAIFAINVCFQ
jgi:hypothetical protein